tara:strand:+ start:391 stop:675 length:285 start_codon:yes stop_codon:yes gene_type:complete
MQVVVAVLDRRVVLVQVTLAVMANSGLMIVIMLVEVLVVLETLHLLGVLVVEVLMGEIAIPVLLVQQTLAAAAVVGTFKEQVERLLAVLVVQVL